MVYPSFEQFDIVVIGKTSSRELVPRFSSVREEASRVEINSHLWSMERMRMVCYYPARKPLDPSWRAADGKAGGPLVGVSGWPLAGI